MLVIIIPYLSIISSCKLFILSQGSYFFVILHALLYSQVASLNMCTQFLKADIYIYIQLVEVAIIQILVWSFKHSISATVHVGISGYNHSRSFSVLAYLASRHVYRSVNRPILSELKATKLIHHISKRQRNNAKLVTLPKGRKNEQGHSYITTIIYFSNNCNRVSYKYLVTTVLLGFTTRYIVIRYTF